VEGMTAMREISVAGCQLLHTQGRRRDNLDLAVSMIRDHPGHDLYVLSELASSGYGIEAFRALPRLAEDEDGPSYQTFSELAREQGCAIVYSYPGRLASGGYSIRAAAVNARGEPVASYDKWHICQLDTCDEGSFFEQGSGPPAVFEIGAVRVGLGICYDIRFPEMIRLLALEYGIHLLAHPSGWPRDSGFATWHPFVITRAVENGIAIMSVNRAGDQNGCSVFCPAYVDGDQRVPRVLGEETGVLEAVVSVDALEEIRATIPLRRDRRPEKYTPARFQY